MSGRPDSAPKPSSGGSAFEHAQSMPPGLYASMGFEVWAPSPNLPSTHPHLLGHMWYVLPVQVPQGYNEWNDTVAMVNEHRKVSLIYCAQMGEFGLLCVDGGFDSLRADGGV